MGRRRGIRNGLTFAIGILLGGCGQGVAEPHAVGPPTTTVGQMTEWPQGFEPGGGLREVEMPAEARRHVVLASPDAAGHQDYFQTFRRE